MSSTCPLCQKANHCSGNATCWCFQVNVPQALIDKLDDKDKDKHCICDACITEFNQASLSLGKPV